MPEPHSDQEFLHAFIDGGEPGWDASVRIDAHEKVRNLFEQLVTLEDKPDQPLQNAARRLVKATDNAERNYALADLMVALERDSFPANSLHPDEADGLEPGETLHYAECALPHDHAGDCAPASEPTCARCGEPEHAHPWLSDYASRGCLTFAASNQDRSSK